MEKLFDISGEHWVATAVRLLAFTDNNDTLTRVTRQNLFARSLFEDMTGDIFFLEDMQSGDAYVIISDNADYNNATLKIEKGEVFIDSDGCDLSVIKCRAGGCESACRKYLASKQSNDSLVTMSNTWGDRNGSTRVCHDFVMKEIDAAEALGIDIVQVDDGWQMGDTAWKSERDERGRIFADGYWDCNLERFPDGLLPCTEYAKSKNIKLGMWFAPDSRNDYAHIERDIAVLKNAYDNWGVRFFKLDMYYVTTDTEKQKMRDILDAIYSFGNDVSVQMDITRHSRLNYLAAKEYGTVFAENRYTGSANSFPHRILRNLWSVGRFIPTSRFQFEIVNPDLNTDKYEKNDPFAPCHYDMDYLFATVMMSNPLFWMELQFLSEKRRGQLKNIMSVWKDIRDDLIKCDVKPIGEKPSGRSLTGFYAKDDDTDYLIVFREVTDRDKIVIATDKTDFTLLATNADTDVKIKDGNIAVTFSKERAYAVIKLG